MLVSFPNMGPNWVAFKTLFTALDLDVVLPDPLLKWHAEKRKC